VNDVAVGPLGRLDTLDVALEVLRLPRFFSPSTTTPICGAGEASRAAPVPSLTLPSVEELVGSVTGGRPFECYLKEFNSVSEIH